MPLEMEELEPGGFRLYWAVCNTCQARGVTTESPEEALAAFHPMQGREHVLCEACFIQEVNSPTVRSLIADLRLRFGTIGEELDLRQGSVLRSLVEASASALGDLRTFTSDRATELVINELHAQLGPEVNLSPGSNARRMVDEVIESAVAERQNMMSSIIGSYIATQEGRSRLAQAMVAPLTRQRNMARLAREVFPIQQLPDGAVPIYDREEPWPDWVRVGVWVRPTLEGAPPNVFRIIAVGDVQVTLQGVNVTIPVNKTLSKNWEPCEPPIPGPSRYERLSLGAELV